MIQVNNVFPYDVSEGAVLDYIDNQFMAVFCDEKWSEEEIVGLRRKKLNISLVVRGNLLIFLISVDDLIEVSDFPFIYNVQDHNLDLSHTYEKDEGISFSIYLITKDLKVCALKQVKLNATMSNYIVEIAKLQIEADYDVMMGGLEKMQLKYEPFEMEEFIVCTNLF